MTTDNEFELLDKAIQTYWELEKQRQEATAMLRRKIAALNHEIDVAERPIRAVQESMRELIETEAMKLERSHKNQHGAVTYVRGYDKTKWDGEKLLDMARDFPCIMAAREILKVEPSVRIKLNID